MSIEFLRLLAARGGPLTVTRPNEVAALRQLREVGLIQAFTLRPRGTRGLREVGRFLTLTPEGRQALVSNQAAGRAK